MKSNYRIIRIEDEKFKNEILHNKITMCKFYAKNNNAAYKYLKDYIRCANKAYTYYFEPWNPTYVMQKDGTHKEYDDVSSLFAEDKNTSKIAKFFDDCRWTLWKIFVDNPVNMWHQLEDIWYWIKNKHSYKESWSLDEHVLDDLKWNIEKLITSKIGIPFVYCDAARKQLHKNDKSFDLDKYNKEHVNYTDEEEKLAAQLKEKSYREMIEYIDYYHFFGDGHLDDTEFTKKHANEFPYVKGTYDTVDYKKALKLQQSYWNKIWDWMRNYGQTLWD